jgi:Spy/CpxP family protein refolding chaperone
MKVLRVTTAICLLFGALPYSPASAQPAAEVAGEPGSPAMSGEPGPGGPPFLDNVFPPGLVMRYQAEIGLTDEQRSAITKLMEEAQKTLIPLQWDVARESEKLSKLMQPNHIDEAAALQQADHVMTAENQLKKEHLALLIRIKNQLTPVQQQQLRQLRPEHHHGGPR